MTFEADEEADAAIEGMDQIEWKGRILMVEKAFHVKPVVTHKAKR